MYSRILVPTDFSRPSFAAFEPAMRIASKFGSRVYLLHVLEPVPVFAFKMGLSQTQLEARLQSHSQTELKRASKRLRVKKLELLLRRGSAGPEILKLVRAKKIDLVIMGTHGRTGFEQMILGSVTENVVRLAPCDVLTVKL
jgi:universal stress protein A